MPARQQAFLSWAGLRGAVPIVLATVPLAAGVRGAPFLFDVVLVFVVVFTCLQAPTLPFVGRRLGLIDDETARDVEVEVAPLDQISADLLQVRIPPGSRLAGVEVGELRLPEHTVVSLIIRDEAPFTPAARERIKVGDELLVVTPADQRDEHRGAAARPRPRRPAGALARADASAERRGRRQLDAVRALPDRLRRVLGPRWPSAASTDGQADRGRPSPRWRSWRPC